MAVAGSALKRQQCAKSAFGNPLKSTGFSRIQPPLLHKTGYLTGGLSELYKRIRNPDQKYSHDEEYLDFTDENGSFSPTEQVPLLAKRYRFVGVIGKGCSATLLQAVDTFRPSTYHVAIKVLNWEYYDLGYQESNNVERLNHADPYDFSGTVRLLNTFSFGGHFCLVFELLHPKPLHQYFKRIPTGQKKLQLVRKVALRLLQVLGFLQQENIIHADLKPENVLCRSEDLSSGVKVIDFGNAIHCVYDELSLYYDDFELQTLLYRAPEVVFGLPFGPEIDMWSVGCILAELYLGEPLFFAVTKEELLQKMVGVLGPLPVQVFQRGKFYSEYESYIGKPQSALEMQNKLFRRLGDLPDYNFSSFILSILQYNPNERMTVSDAFLHPFLAPEVAARFLIPPGSKAGKSMYNKISIPASTYTLSPEISSEVTADHLSSVDLLRRGTASTQLCTVPAKRPKRAVAEVAPFSPVKQDVTYSPVVVRQPVKGGAPAKGMEVSAAVFTQETYKADIDVSHLPGIRHSPLISNPQPTFYPDQSKNAAQPKRTKPLRQVKQDERFSPHRSQSHCRASDSSLASTFKTEVTDQEGSRGAKNEGISRSELKPIHPGMKTDTVVEQVCKHDNQPELKEKFGTDTRHLKGDVSNDRPCETRGSNPAFQSLQKSKLHHREASQDPHHHAASSPVSVSPARTKEINIGILTDHIESTIEEQYLQHTGYSQRSEMSRFKHLTKMKADALKDDKSLEFRELSDPRTDEMSAVECDTQRTSPETGDPVLNTTPARSTNEALQSTPSSSQDNFNDCLNLLTPLSSQTMQSSSQQSSEDRAKIVPDGTQKTSRQIEINETQNDNTTWRRLKRPANSEAKKALEDVFHKHGSLGMFSVRQENPKLPLSSADNLNLQRPGSSRDTDSLPSDIQDSNLPGSLDHSYKLQVRNTFEASGNRRRIGLDKDSPGSGFRKAEMDQDCKQVPCGRTEEDQQAGQEIGLKEGDPTISSSSSKQTTHIVLTPRLSVRKSKTQAQERIKIKARRGPMSRELCRWWELNHKGPGLLEDKVIPQTEEKEESRGMASVAEDLQRVSRLGAVNLDSETKTRNKEITNTSHRERPATTCRPTRCIGISPNNTASSLKRKYTRKPKGLTGNDTEKEKLISDVYAFESTEEVQSQVSKKPHYSRRKQLCFGMKSGKKVQQDSRKLYHAKGTTQPSRKGRIETTANNELLDKRTSKLKKLGAVQDPVIKSHVKLRRDLEGSSPEQTVNKKRSRVRTLPSNEEKTDKCWRGKVGVRTVMKSTSPKQGLMSKRRKIVQSSDAGREGVQGSLQDGTIIASSHTAGCGEQHLPLHKDVHEHSKHSAKTSPPEDSLNRITQSHSVKLQMDFTLGQTEEKFAGAKQKEHPNKNQVQRDDSGKFAELPRLSPVHTESSSNDDDDEVLLL